MFNKTACMTQSTGESRGSDFDKDTELQTPGSLSTCLLSVPSGYITMWQCVMQ